MFSNKYNRFIYLYIQIFNCRKLFGQLNIGPATLRMMVFVQFNVAAFFGLPRKTKRSHLQKKRC